MVSGISLILMNGLNDYAASVHDLYHSVTCLESNILSRCPSICFSICLPLNMYFGWS